MIEAFSPALIVIIILAVVVLLNWGIVKSFSGKSNRKGKVFSRAIQSAKNPWKQESDQLDELSRLVKLATGDADDQQDRDDSAELGE